MTVNQLDVSIDQLKVGDAFKLHQEASIMFEVVRKEGNTIYAASTWNGKTSVHLDVYEGKYPVCRVLPGKEVAA